MNEVIYFLEERIFALCYFLSLGSERIYPTSMFKSIWTPWPLSQYGMTKCTTLHFLSCQLCDYFRSMLSTMEAAFKYFTLKKNVGVLTFEVADKTHAQLTKYQSSCANNILKRFNAEISNPSQLDFLSRNTNPRRFWSPNSGDSWRSWRHISSCILAGVRRN